MGLFGQISISIPCYEEQAKIARILSALDDAICQAKTELNQYRLLKKGLLQQMF